jgi:hypothetical protein
LAASLVPSNTVSVTWSRGSTSASSGVPAKGVPSSSSSLMLAKSNASWWPKPCGVWNASAVVVRPSIARVGVLTSPIWPPMRMSPMVLTPRTPWVAPSLYVSVRLVLAATLMSGLSGTLRTDDFCAD